MNKGNIWHFFFGGGVTICLPAGNQHGCVSLDLHWLTQCDLFNGEITSADCIATRKWSLWLTAFRKDAWILQRCAAAQRHFNYHAAWYKLQLLPSPDGTTAPRLCAFTSTCSCSCASAWACQRNVILSLTTRGSNFKKYILCIWKSRSLSLERIAVFNDTELRATLFLLRRVVYFRECQRSESSTIHFIMKIINIKYIKSHK